jgi:hypothetical protein
MRSEEGSTARQSLRLALEEATAQARRRAMLVGWAVGLALCGAFLAAGVMVLSAIQ